MATALGVAPLSQDRSDVDLVAAVRRGNDAAFEELYSRYSQRIGAYVRGMVGDHGRAEDITQEIFISALRRMRDTDRPIAFKPWIYEIAKNACIDSFRRTRRAQEVSLDADDTLSSADRGRLAMVTTPDAALDSKQALHDLRGAFGGLSESHHEILVLRELEGRSYSDIGERLGMSRPVVESTLFRARRRLAEEYDELTSGRRCEFVRKMVDSGPHYSLGIRDRRRMARHFAHCQPCRAHARAAGFDDSILNMPSVASKIVAFLPIPLLRARLGGVGHLGSDRGRPSFLVLARSCDQIVGMGTGAGRGAATAAALVIAGVGGGIVTVTSSQRANPSHRAGVHASAHGAAAGRMKARASRVAADAKRAAHDGKLSRTATGAGAGSSRGIRSATGTWASAGSSDASRGAPSAQAPLSPAPASSAPGMLGVPASAGNAGAPVAAGTGAAGTPIGAGTVGATTPTTAGPASNPTGTVTTPTVPTGAVPNGTVPSGAVPTGSVPTASGPSGSVPTATVPSGIVPPGLGNVKGKGSAPKLPPPSGGGGGGGDTPAVTVKGAIGGVAGQVGDQLGVGQQAS